MKFFNQLKIQYKIGLLPFISLIGFLVYLGFSLYSNNQNEQRFSIISEQDYPILEIVNNDWLLLLKMEANFKEAILEEDDEFIQLAQQDAIKIEASFRDINQINYQHDSKVVALQLSFSKYFTSALSVAQVMVAGETDTATIQEQLQLMRQQYARFKALLAKFKKSIELSFVIKLQQSKVDAARSSLLGIIIAAILIVILFISSVFITQLITRRLRYIIGVAEEISKGNWDVELEKNESSNDELGKMISAFANMKEQIAQTISELITARNEAFKADQVKSEFLSTMSHELRTPMNGVLGMTELLKSTKLDETQTEYINIVLSSGQLLMDIINDILDFSKLDKGSTKLEKIEFDLEFMVYDVQKALASTLKENLQLIINYQADAPCDFIGDPSHLRQVLFNLIGNAIKFTLQGVIRIDVKCETVAPNSVNVSIAIDDTGIGIHPEQILSLFNAFSQADSSTTRKYGGTGLGLAISQKLVTLMGSEILVESKLGSGSRFYFTLQLPLAESHLNRKLSSLNNIRILVLDNDVTNGKYFSKILQFYGAKVTRISEFDSFLVVLQKVIHSDKAFQMAIVNCDSSSQKSLDLAINIRNHVQLNNLALIAVLSTGQLTDKVVYEKAGFSAYVRLPVPRKIIESILSLLLDESRQSDKIVSAQSLLAHENTLDKLEIFKGHILLAEDTKMNQIVAMTMLSKLGLSYDLAVDGLQALEYWRTNHYDLILMDCRMPTMNGYEAAENIRAEEPKNCHIPIIALTANVSRVDRDKCLRRGMDELVSKPFQINDLSRVFKAWLEYDKGSKQVGSESDNNNDQSSAVNEISQIIDFSVFKKVANSAADSFPEMIDTFFDEVEYNLEALRSWQAGGNVEDLISYPHSIKLVCSGIGAVTLTELATECEIQIGQGKIEQALSKINKLTAEYQKLITVLEVKGYKRSKN